MMDPTITRCGCFSHSATLQKNSALAPCPISYNFLYYLNFSLHLQQNIYNYINSNNQRNQTPRQAHSCKKRIYTPPSASQHALLQQPICNIGKFWLNYTQCIRLVLAGAVSVTQKRDLEDPARQLTLDDKWGTRIYRIE